MSVAGNGVITIEAKAAAKSTTFTAVVTDAGKGRETMTVTVIAAPVSLETEAAKSGKTTSSTPAAACSNPDPAVKELQEGLRALGITKGKVDDVEKELVVDGCAGKITTAAARQFYIKQGLTEADIEKDEAKLMKQAAADVKEAVKKKQGSK